MPLLIEIFKNSKGSSEFWRSFSIISSNNNNNKYILLVDDEKDILELFSECLKSEGYEIISFDNPIDAINYLDNNENNISDCSLVITDYKMPQISGLDLIRKVREKDVQYKIKIILISAHMKDDILKDKTSILRNDKIIEKPIPLEKLKNEVTELFK